MHCSLFSDAAALFCFVCCCSRVQMALVVVLLAVPKCKRKVFGAKQGFQDTTEHKEMRQGLEHLLVVENEAQGGGSLGLQVRLSPPPH